MKWAILMLIIGILEIWIIGLMHDHVGTAKLIAIYVATTAIGALFLYIQFPKYRESIKATKGSMRKWKKKAKDPEYKPTVEDVEKLKPLIFVAIYSYAAILVAIPGILSDILGIVLSLSIVSDGLVNYQFKKAVEKQSRECSGNVRV